MSQDPFSTPPPRRRLWAWLLAAILIIVAVVAIVCLCVHFKQPARDFPIDAVCLWVDGSDPVWMAAAAAAFEEEQRLHPHCGVVHSELREPERVPPFAKDELYYGCKLVEKHMPWLRTYYLVTAKPHKPWWWKERMGNTRCVIVHHEDIFDDVSRLPTFNSVTIQTQLSNIPGLAEHFILFDDDFFVGQPMKRTDFFTADGTQAVAHTYPLHAPSMPPGNWRILCQNMMEMGREIMGPGTRVRVPDHVAMPLFKSLFREVTHNISVKRSLAMHKFRSSVDYVPHYVTVMLMLARKKLIAAPKSIRTQFLSYYDDVRTSAFPAQAPHMFCINDRLKPEDVEYLQRLLLAL